MVNSDQNTSSNNESSNLLVVQWNFHEYSMQVTITVFLFVIILIKFGHSKIPHLAKYVPESLLLIIFGIIFGSIVRFGIEKKDFEHSVWQLTPTLFFKYLLPPIILESSYSLYNKTFRDYLGVVMIFAVIGTILNFFFIGFAMFGLHVWGAFGNPPLLLNIKHFLLFSSLIVAVDPVAVLAIFQDVGVELNLYYIVFGESLFNDAITVVLYQIMIAFVGNRPIMLKEIGLGIASFFTISIGGLLIGMVVGIISCLITRIKSQLNVIVLILLAYFSYIIADSVGWSGIISMIGCGLIQAAYAFHNLDKESVVTVHLLTKLLAQISESIIFLFLGVQTFSGYLQWHTGFILWSLFICLLSRFVIVFSLTAIINKMKMTNSKISLTQQTILFYGGLRGAVAFSLATVISQKKLGPMGEYNRHLIITSTLFIIMFTVGLMGITIKPLVHFLKIRMQDKVQLSLFNTLNDNIIDELLAGIEVIVGTTGKNVVRDLFIRLDEKYVRKFLQTNPENHDQKILKIYDKIALTLHYAQVQNQDPDLILQDLPKMLKKKYLSLLSLECENNIRKISSNDNNWIPVPKPGNSLDDDVEMSKPNTTNESNIYSQYATKTNYEISNLDDHVRKSRRVTLIPEDKRQLGFDDLFWDMMKSRRKALEHRTSIKTLPPKPSQEGRGQRSMIGTTNNRQSMILNDQTNSKYPNQVVSIDIDQTKNKKSDRVRFSTANLEMQYSSNDDNSYKQE